jgi:hypothetical protein
MMPADAPNASDGPLAATKPPEDPAAQPTGDASRTRRVPAAAQRQPDAHSMIAAYAAQPRASVRSKPRFTIAGAIRSP